jgi:hypothetical protein
MTKFSHIYYSKLVLGLVVILSIMSNTLFSLGYIIVLCLIMYENDRFLSVRKARESLVPLFRNFVMPYMIFEMFCQLIYQLPIDAFNPNLEHNWVAQYLPQILGLHKYYSINTTDQAEPVLEEGADQGVLQLWCKALVYFLISIQIQIITSRGFESLSNFLQIGELQGKAVAYWLNNLKVRQYFGYQNKNLRKEQMMVKVRKQCDEWKELFEKRDQ